MCILVIGYQGYVRNPCEKCVQKSLRHKSPIETKNIVDKKFIQLMILYTFAFTNIIDHNTKHEFMN